MFKVERNNSVFFAFLFFFFVNLVIYTDKIPLYHEEPRRTIIAQEMLLSGDYITPTVCRENYLKKPPFQNWLILLEGKLTGRITNLEARLPSIIAFLLTAIFLFLLFEDRRKGFVSSFIFMTSYVTLISYSNKAEPDMVFTFLTFMAYYFFVKGESVSYFLSSSLFMGVSILTKGISPMFFYPAFLIYYFFKKEDLPKNAFKLILHFVLSMLLPLLWLYLYSLNSGLNPLFSMYTREVSSRMVGSLFEIFSHILVFPLRVLLALFPWSIVFIFIFNKDLFKNSLREKLFSTSFLFVLIVFIAMTVFPGGRGRYFMPAVPFFAIILTYFCPKSLPLKRVFKYSGFGILLFFYTVFSFYLFKNGYVFQGSVLILMGLTMFYFLKKDYFVFDFLVVFSTFLFFFYIHGIYFYRANTKKKYNHIAGYIYSILPDKSKPIIVDNTLKPEFVSLALNLERLTGEFVYSNRVLKMPSSFYLITSKNNLKDCKLLFKCNCSKNVPALYVFKCTKSKLKE